MVVLVSTAVIVGTVGALLGFRWHKAKYTKQRASMTFDEHFDEAIADMEAIELERRRWSRWKRAFLTSYRQHPAFVEGFKCASDDHYRELRDLRMHLEHKLGHTIRRGRVVPIARKVRGRRYA